MALTDIKIPLKISFVK